MGRLPTLGQYFAPISTSLYTYAVGLRPLYNKVFLSVRGPFLFVRICRRQILTYKDDPRAERVKEVMRYFVFQRRNNIQYMYIRNLKIFAARLKSNIQM